MVEIRGTGGATGETSYYSALEGLLNEVGRMLDPPVICNGQLKSQGAGHPDFGLYSKKQCQKGEPKPGQGEIPERGVIEVKPLADDTWQTAKGKQATKYFDRYRLVLITNYREFRLVGEDDAGKPVQREFYSLAPDEGAFWSLAAHPVKASKEQAAHFVEFLKRVLMNAAPLTRAEDVAWFLASYARDALLVLEQKDATTLAPLRAALETALGIKFEGSKGEHFFRSTLIQTLFYGVFSAWVVWARDGGTSRFDWRHSGFILTVPMIRSLFEEIAKPSRLAPLGLMDFLDRTGEALGRVDRRAFFKNFDTGQAIQHFYEPFLRAFDLVLQKELGVWYTPPEIVQYIVERVDQMLRSELGLADGLADKNVFVLDPCCGTGAFIVEVLRRIEKTLRDKGADALLADDIKEAARTRIFGFEILSAPFVIAHWQLGSFLAGLGAPLDPGKDERAGVYLTNALTGWEPPKGPKARLPLFPNLERERDAAEHVKRDVPILVVLGNPPYNAFAGTSPAEEHGLVEPYKEGLIKKWRVKKFNLDELYVRFMRLAERRIAEGTKRGVVCYISSFSYVADPSFVVMRERLLKQFDSIWIDCLNGDSRETGKRTPTGEPDPSAFSTEYNTAGIRLGTAIGLFARKLPHEPALAVRYRDFWGRSKRHDLLNSLAEPDLSAAYLQAAPSEENRFSFRPQSVSVSFRSWPKVVELCGMPPIAGLQEMRYGSLMSFDREALERQISFYLDPTRTWAEVVAAQCGPSRDAGGFSAQAARVELLSKETFSTSNIRRYSLYPLDNRWAYWTAVPTMWNRARPQLVAQAFSENRFFVVRMTAERPGEGVPAIVTMALPDYHLLRPNVVAIPFMLEHHGDGLFAIERRANLSMSARGYLLALGLPDPDSDPAVAQLIWLHALAICFSSRYRTEHRDGVLADWPRVPLPGNRTALEASAALGAKLTTLLDPDKDVPGVSRGNIGAPLTRLGVLTRVDGRQLTLADLGVSAGWGRRMTTGVVMPGSGRVEKRAAYAPDDASAIGEKAARVLGPPLDIMLNSVAAWRTVPFHVWEYRIGGYQVIKKWLSYREEAVLGRPLSRDEAREVTGMVRRLASIILMGDELDANYAAVRNSTYSWPITASG